MKKLKLFFIGVFIIAISFFIVKFFVTKYLHGYYYNQLKEYIIDKYMDGEDAIGSISFDNDSKKTRIYKPGSYIRNNQGSENIPLEVSVTGMFNEGFFDNSHILNEISDVNKYQSWAYVDNLECIVVKRTKRGFDIIEEKIFGIGFKQNIINDPSLSKKEILKFPKIVFNDGKLEIVDNEYDYSERYYLSNLNLCNDYIKYLVNEKYCNVKFQQIYSELMKLRMNQFASTIEERYFHNNDFYELRPDDFYEGRTCYQAENRYGNYFSTLYGTTITIKYAIQPKGEKLDNYLFVLYIVVVVSLSIIWGGYCFVIRRHSK